MCSRSLRGVNDDDTPATPPAPTPSPEPAPDEPRDSTRRAASGPMSLDGVTGFMGMRWQDPETVSLAIRPELINRGGLLSGVVTYALVDYCMGSTLWAQTTARGAHRDDQHLDQLHPERGGG